MKKYFPQLGQNFSGEIKSPLGWPCADKVAQIASGIPRSGVGERLTFSQHILVREIYSTVDKAKADVNFPAPW